MYNTSFCLLNWLHLFMKTARNISAYEGHDSNDSLYFKMNYPYIIRTEKCSEVIDHKLYCFHGILFSILSKIWVYPRILIYNITKRKNKNVTIILSTHVVVIFWVWKLNLKRPKQINCYVISTYCNQTETHLTWNEFYAWVILDLTCW